MQNKNILVVGDVMLDQYLFGEVSRISPEAPIPVFKEKGKERLSPGGAANVAVNLAEIGIHTSLCAVIGSDENGQKLKNLLEEGKVDVGLLMEDRNRITTRKLRYIGPNNQQMLRVDSENTEEPEDSIQEKLILELEKELDDSDLLLISDYAKGLLSYSLTSRIIKLSEAKKVPIFVDVKGNNPKKYLGATLLKPNRKELEELSGMPAKTTEEAVKAAIALCKMVQCKYVMATLGSDGMLLVNQNALIIHVQSTANEVFDVTGAGDTSVAYLAAEYVKGRSIEDAMIAANIAAGIQVSRVGTSVIDPREVSAEMRKMQGESTNMEDSLEDLLYELGNLQLNGEKIVFTNGCFDVLHAGHVVYLKEAKKLGDVLVVGVNDDGSVRRLKGEGRPINALVDRMAVLESLKPVDYVVSFSEDTPINVIKKIRPDVLVKGGDYKVEDIVGADEVFANGGDVKVLPYLEGKSTTGTIDKIRKRSVQDE